MGRFQMTKSAELYACLYAREFPAQALLRLRSELRDQPCVVMEGAPPLEQVCSLTEPRIIQ
jgi:protein ImuB